MTKEQRLQALVEELIAALTEYDFVCGEPAAVFRPQGMSEYEHSALQQICDAKGRQPSSDEMHRIHETLQN